MDLLSYCEGGSIRNIHANSGKLMLAEYLRRRVPCKKVVYKVYKFTQFVIRANSC